MTLTTDTPTRPLRPGSPELRVLLAQIADGAQQRETSGGGTREVIEQLKEAGVGRLRLAVEDGGAGLTIRELFATLIDLAEADSNAVHALRTHFWFVEQQLQTADADARARGLAIIASGAIVGNGFSEQTSQPVGLSFETTFTPTDDGYRLDGTKYYSTGSIYSDYTQIWASAPGGRIAGAVIPVDRAGLTIEDDWDGFGQRQTGTGTTRLVDVHVHPDEYFDLGLPEDEDAPPGYQGAFLQLFLQAVTAGILRSVRNDAVALVRRRTRNFSHGDGGPAHDRQVLQVVGEITADAFAAEAIVLAAADALDAAAESVVDGLPDPTLAEAAQESAALAKVAIDRFSYATAAALFDVGGASATSSQHALDRHWRNIRVISTHNPTFLKASAVGDHLVNGASFPANAYF